MTRMLTTLTASAFALALAGGAQGQLLFDFESGQQGWDISGFGNGTEAVGLSPNGATEGSAQALSMSHDGGAFSWDASWVTGVPDPGNPSDKDAVYNAISDALANPAGKTLEFDFTFLVNDLPTFTSFSNLTFSFQDENNFNQVDNVAGIGQGATDTTVHVSIPLDSGNFAGMVPNSSFYRLTFGPNVDGGRGISTWYADNIQIVPEPASAALLGLGALALRRRRG